MLQNHFVRILAATALITSFSDVAEANSQKAKAAYPPEDWVMNLQFRNFPFEIECREENNRGNVQKRGSGRNTSYKITGFPEADRMICMVEGKRNFVIDMDNLFGVGRTKRVMGGEYFEGEVKRVDLKVQYQSNAVGYGSYKAHAKRFTYRGSDRIIYSEPGMFAAFFPERANQPAKRWEP